MKRLIALCLLLMLFGCQERMDPCHLQVHVNSGITGVSLEGYEVWLYGPRTMISKIDQEGNAYFEFEAPKGESYLVEFNTNFENFNPQGVIADDWSELLVNDKLETIIEVGKDTFVELIAIPSTDITIVVSNQSLESGDSLYLKIEHELFSTIISEDDSYPFTSFNHTAPIGKYTYEGMVYTLNDTTPISGSFDVPHQDYFSHEIRY